jgi:hypothetical protein
MNGRGKSDSSIVPRKLPNKGSGAPQSAEGVEGRGLTKGNPDRQTRFRTQTPGRPATRVGTDTVGIMPVRQYPR